VAEENARTDDPLIRETEEKRDESGTRMATAANLFDLRKIIGGLFVLYGIVLTIVGLLDSDAEVARAAGVRINLYAGLGMLALGLLFLVWSFTRPLADQLESADLGGGPGGDGERAAGDRDARR
jgi:hypothetical protein